MTNCTLEISKPSSGLAPSGKITLVMFIALLLVMGIIFGFMVYSYILALLMGGILALLSYPLYQKLIHKNIYPKIASSIVTCCLVLLVVAPILILTFLATKQGLVVASVLAGKDDFSFQSLLDKISHWPWIDAAFPTPEAAQQQIRAWIHSIGAAVMGASVNIAAHIPQILLQVALALISYFFFLLDGPKFISWLADRIPLDKDVRKKVIVSFNDTTISVIWATLAAAAVQSAIMFLAFVTLSVPAFFLATAATFVFAWIPILGSAPVWLAAILYLYLKGSYFKAILMLAFGIATSVSDNFIRPLVLKGKTNMHPLVSLVAIFGGIGMFGIFGVFIGPIVAAVLISLLQIWPAIGERFGLMSSEDSK